MSASLSSFGLNLEYPGTSQKLVYASGWLSFFADEPLVDDGDDEVPVLASIFFMALSKHLHLGTVFTGKF